MNGSPKLLIMFPSEERGGAEEYCLRIAGHAVFKGWQLHGAFLKTSSLELLKKDFEATGGKYWPLARSPLRCKRAKLIHNVWCNITLLRAVKPDIVLVQLPGARAGFDILLACAILAIPTVVVFQLVRDNVKLRRREIFARALCRRRRQQYVAVSQRNKTILASLHHCSMENITLIHNGADLRRFQRDENQILKARLRLRAQLNVSLETRILLTVARLCDQKGYDVLIDAVPGVLRRFPDSVFLVAGEGSEESNIRQLIKEKKLENNVVLLGRRSDIPFLMHAADVFVFPSRYEGLPFAVIEAMAAGLPVITTNAVGIDGLIHHNQNGLVTKINNPQLLCDIILYALEHPVKMRELAQRALATAQEYSEYAMLESTLTLLYDFMKASS